MPLRIGCYVTFAELRGTKCTIEEFRSELRKFSRDGVVFACSALNCFVANTYEDQLSTQAQLLAEAFPPASLDIINQIQAASPEPRFVFHRRQLLFVAKEAIRWCSDDGLDPRSLRFWGGLGLVLLMANDLLDFDLELGIESEAEIISTVAEFIPIAEHAIGMPSLLNATARSIVMMGRFVESLKDRKEFIDFAARFRNAMGFALADYQALCIAFISYYLKLDINAFRSNPGSFLLQRKEWSRNTAVSESISDAFLSQISATSEEIRIRLEERDYGCSDFTWIRNTPIYSVNEGCYPLDVPYLSEKLQSGPFWVVHDSMLPEERPKLHAFWGLVFEAYMHWLLSSSVGPKNIFVASPKFHGTTNEACDGILRCGSSVAIFEFKGSMLTAQAKYSGEPKLLGAEIDKKLVGSKSDKKGVAQLIQVIRRLFDPTSPSSVEGIDLSETRTIYPVLVTRDDVGAALGINLYLNRKFREAFNPRCVRPLRVTPLFCMSVEDLEFISGYLGEAAFTEILQARYDGDRYLASTFSAVNNEVIRKIGRRRNTHLEQAFAAGMDNVCERLFPGRRLEHPYLRQGG